MEKDNESGSEGEVHIEAACGVVMDVKHVCRRTEEHQLLRNNMLRGRQSHKNS